MASKSALKEVAWVFFKLGSLSFGGPAAHIAIMEEEVVDKRKWMSRQHFLDLMGATNLIPGPNSTEMTMHCGHERAGILGLFIAGLCFVFPAVVISGIFGYLYLNYGQLPEVAPFVAGIKPAVLSIIAAAVIKLGRKALKGWELGLIGTAVLVASLLGVNEIIALLAGGIIGALYFWLRTKNKVGLSSPLHLLLISSSASSIGMLGSGKIFWTFLKVGSVLYGSGYVLFAYLDAELVSNNWLSRQELMDAIAVGQFTPGPVLSTATFIGYQLNGLEGALAATAGIFLPSFFFVWILNPLIPKMRKSVFLRGFLDSVNIAAVAVMVAVLLVMSLESLVDWRSISIASIGLLYTFGLKKSNAVWVVVGGAVLGYLLSLF